jgi:hypothetical protein
MARSTFLALALCVGVAAGTAHAQATLAYTPVTDARLQHPEPRNWLLFRGSYDAQG